MLLDDPVSEKAPIRHARRLGSRKAGCVQVLDDSESSNTKFGHKTLAMVKRYAHLSEAHTHSVVERRNRAVFGEP